MPLIWDKKPDEQGGRIIGYTTGLVKWVEEKRAVEILEQAGQNR